MHRRHSATIPAVVSYRFWLFRYARPQTRLGLTRTRLGVHAGSAILRGDVSRCRTKPNQSSSSGQAHKIRWSGSSVTSSQERRVRRPSARRARSGQPTGCSARLPVTRVGVLILHHVGWSRSLSLRLGCVPGACCCTPCRAGRSASSGGASLDAPAAGLISPG